ncbi:MAG: hypothetical protein HY951_02195 [Bacteroidia bacterium]|nr:hypothetical protein [Bacteroidia bacterium]
MKIRFLYFILILVVFLGCKKDKNIDDNIEDNLEDNEIIIQTDYRDKVVGYYSCSYNSDSYNMSGSSYYNGFDTIHVIKDSVSPQLIHFLIDNHDLWPLGKVLNSDYSLVGYGKSWDYFSGSFTLGDSSITLHLSYGGQSPGGSWNTHRNGVKF